MILDTLAKFKAAFFRHLGTKSDDDALVENGESVDDVVLLYLTHGCWAAQHVLCDAGFGHWWRKRSAVLTWSGTDATTGGRYWSLPADFLRMSGDRQRSSLVKANGDRWGWEADERDDADYGNAYYVKGAKLWLLRGASPPTDGLYLDYIAKHAEWTADLGGSDPGDPQLDFPEDLRPLIPALAAEEACGESWVPVSDAQQQKIESVVGFWTRQAQKVARRSRAPRQRRVARRIPGYLVN